MNGISPPVLPGCRRAPALLFALLLLLALFHPPAANGRQERGGGFFIVVSITQLGQGTIDVKLKNPRTGYVHSVTLHISLPLKFKVGDLVEKRQDPRRGVVLIPVRDEVDGPDEGGGEDEGHERPVGLPETPPERNPVSPETKGPLKGYIVQPIKAMRVLNNHNAPKDPRLAKTTLESEKCDLLVNGSFTANFVIPAVPVVRAGKLDTAGYGKSLHPDDNALTQDGKGKITTDRRGGVAVYDNGSVAVGRQNGRTLEQITQAFGKVYYFMGGGALLIEKGQAVSSTDLFEQQGFADQRGTSGKPKEPPRVVYDKGGRPMIGLNAGQFSVAQHTLVGMKDGKAFVIISPKRNGSQLQADLVKAQFQDVVKLDGGYGFYFTDGVTEIKGREDGKEWGNSLGLCIWTR
jgi:hypothetical protein